MEIRICDNAAELGRSAAKAAAAAINRAIAEKGEARIALSTGASQFETLAALVREGVDWGKVVMFHLDEYENLPESHPASFRKYLKERFLAFAPVKEAHLIAGDAGQIAELSRSVRQAPIDLGVIGIGENAHIAFNDPPADLETREAYKLVTLNAECKRQQVREGWFATEADVPARAISMTVHQILQCRAILSCVPHAVKAEAVRAALFAPQGPLAPAAMLRGHADWTLYLDRASAARILAE